MIRTLLISATLAFTPAAFALDHDSQNDHTAHQHEDHDHASHDHGTHEHQKDGHAGHDDSSVTLSRTPEIEAALAVGGEPVVVEVLGAVCDFCAKAMNRTFGRRDDVSAVYVDLDAKTLNLVLSNGASIDDNEITRIVVRSGYKAKAIHRGEHILGGDNASDPA